jgi:hypothetical protein
MATATTGLEDVALAFMDALQVIADEIPELQVVAYVNNMPTPPSLDVYPSDPFIDPAGFGVGDALLAWTVRARVSQVDPVAGMQTLYRLMDPGDPAGVEPALANVAVLAQGGVSGWRTYPSEATGDQLLGCEWRFQRFLKGDP